MPTRKQLTYNDFNVLDVLVEWTDSYPYPPSVRDIGRRLNLSYSSVDCALRRLQLRGLIDRTPGVSRSLRPLSAGRTALKEGRDGRS
jgi:repressor LexA